MPQKHILTWAREAATETRLDRGTHDFGVRLCVVRQDLEHGTEYLPGKPPLKLLRTHELGGLWSPSQRRFVGPSLDPIIWFASERQEPVVLGETKASRTLLYSAEGGGKTSLGAMWLVAEVIRLAHAGIFCAVGITAPTHERLQLVVKAISDRIPVDAPKEPKPGSLATYYTEAREFHFVTGHVAQCRSTKRQSEATGSPIQGATWARSLDDELQDTVANGADPDIEARLRGVKVTKRLGTATAKDSPLWRSFRDQKLSTPDWGIERIRFDENPFEWPERWETMRRNVSLREWQRRGLAMDVGPERMVYTTWSREENLRPVPQLGARDVTAEVLSPWGANIKVLLGHDPGKLCNVTTFLKAYRVNGTSRVCWWIVDEVVTNRTTAEEHIKVLLDRLRNKWGCNRRVEHGDMCLVRSDPYSNSGNDTTKPDKSIYTTFRSAGIHILPASTKAVMTAAGAKTVSVAIPKEAGIQMVVGLLSNADGDRRLFVDCDDHRQPVAPRAVESFELSERNGDGEAESQRKDENDLSHFTATVRYALWQLEKPKALAARRTA